MRSWRDSAAPVLVLDGGRRNRLLFVLLWLLIWAALPVGGALAQGGAITAGQSVSGELTTASGTSTARGPGYYADRYTFSASAGQVVTLSTTSGMDTYGYLSDAGGSVIASDDDSNGSLNFRIVSTVPATGAYTVEVTTYGQNVTGPYTLTLTVANGAAPTGLTASGSDGAVSLSWAASAGATGYTVSRSAASGGPYTAVSGAGTVSGTTYTDTGLTNGTPYYYTVTATYAAGESGASNEASATPYVPPPSVTAASVKWQNVGGYPYPQSASSFASDAPNVYDGSVGDTATGYSSADSTAVLYDLGSSVSVSGVETQYTGGYYYYCSAYVSDDGVNWTSVGTLYGGGYTQTFSPVTARYVQFVIGYSGTSITDARVFDGNGNAVLGPPLAPPDAPTDLSASPGNQFVSLTWTAPAGTGLTYNVYRGTSAGGESATAVASNLTSASYTDSSLTNGTTYYYTVKAVNGIGAGASSGEANATPSLVVPAAPTNLTATPGDGQVSLSWTASPGATGYSLFRGTSAGGEGATAIATPSGASYTDTGVTNGTTYYYTVKATDGAGSSAAGNESSATPQAIPAAPTNLTATGASHQVSLTWTASAGATGYHVQRATTSGGPYTTVGSPSGTAYTDTNLTNGTAYFYVVTAVNAVGESGASNEASATPQPVALTAASVKWQNVGGYPYPQSASSFSADAPNVYDGSVGDTATGYGGTDSTYVLYDLGSSVSVSGVETQYTGGYYYYCAAYVSDDGTNWTSVGTLYGYGYTQTFSPVTARYVQFVIGYSGTSITDARVFDGDGNPVLGPPPAPPAAPTNLTASPGNQFVALTWTAPAGTGLTYNVYRGATAGGEDATALVSGLTSASYTDTNLTNGTAYYYTVKAVNAQGAGAASNEASATPALVAPAAPTNLVAAPANAHVALTWTASPGATGYSLFRGTSAGGEDATALATPSGTSYMDSAVTNGTTYYYVVKATNGAGSSPAGNEVSATPQPVPDAPTNLVATSGDAQVSLTWTASAGAASYSVQRATTSGGPYTTVGGPAGTTYNDTNLTNGTTYYYVVTAVNPVGESSPSNQASATPILLPPPAPVGLAATAGDGQVSLSWTSVANATGYNIYRGTSAGGEGATPVAQLAAYYVYYGDYGLPNGTAYYYWVTAVGPGGEGDHSNEASATPGSTPLPAPLGIKAVAGNASATVAWSAVAGATSYNLYRSVGTGSPPTIYRTGLSATPFTDTNLTNGTQYNYAVAAVSAGGQGTLSNAVSATPGSTPLPAPTNLTATAGSSQVALQWDAVSGAHGYNVYRATTPGGEGSVPYYTFTYGYYSSWTDQNVVNGVTYYYKVAAFDDTGEGPLSSEVSAQPTFAFSAAPASVSIPQGGSGVVAVSTDSVSPVTLGPPSVPAGVTGWFLFNPITNATSNDSVYLCVGAGVPQGIYTLTFTGTSGSATRTATVQLTVTAPSP